MLRSGVAVIHLTEEQAIGQKAQFNRIVLFKPKSQPLTSGAQYVTVDFKLRVIIGWSVQKYEKFPFAFFQGVNYLGKVTAAGLCVVSMSVDPQEK